MTRDYLNTVAAAKLLGVRPHTLRVWRHKGKGPAYHRLGDSPSARVVYAPEDIDEWMEKRRFLSTTAETQTAAIAG